jgi:ABC-2 type transport system permease protein
MSTGVLSSPATKAATATPATDHVRVTFPRVVRSEWIKFRTLRSTIWTLAITLVLMVGIVTLFAVLLATQDFQRGGPSSTDAFTIAGSMASIAVVVLGVLVITGEYSTGMIRSTLAAVPRRLPALWAKGLVLAASILVVSAVAVGISLGVMQLFVGSKGLAPDLGNAETVRILVGIPLYLTGLALLAFAIGALLRHSAGALATVLGLLLVIENLFMIPWKPLQLISPFLPGTAGGKLLMSQGQLDAMTQGSQVGAVLSPWQGYGVLLAWVAVLLTVGALLLRRRNA